MGIGDIVAYIIAIVVFIICLSFLKYIVLPVGFGGFSYGFWMWLSNSNTTISVLLSIAVTIIIFFIMLGIKGIYEKRKDKKRGVGKYPPVSRPINLEESFPKTYNKMNNINNYMRNPTSSNRDAMNNK